MSGKLHVRLDLRRDDFHLDVDFDVPARGITALYGASGSGKTSLLRAVAGLEAKARGRVALGEAVWLDTDRGVNRPPHRRPLGYVFQQGGLFPHLTVADNLAYALKRVPVERRRATLDDIVNQTELGSLLARKPDQLSGGQRQRTALARALLTGADLMLLDEPLASLDKPARLRLLPFLEQLGNRTAGPVLYVTHFLDEVCRLADQVVLLKDGRVAGQGPLLEILNTPHPLLAAGDEARSVLMTTVAEHDPVYHLTRLNFDGGDLLVPHVAADVGAARRVRINARDVSLTRNPTPESSILNVIPAVVEALIDAGPARVLVRLAAGRSRMLAMITRRSAEQLNLAPGLSLHAQVKSVALL